ncbi:bifunctional 5,10-methylenetetrahydrofolate dehydrogenase/5,10-methenyltetrahydrofolate cyclohydrolase [Curvivirga aplysinae]|uniref:bifunctional 5,10-methylenetetrahydrofolate dehydrogenase/5,10-methenyltetrahydrofolate cyclohydrolase n=1 Tax=Curvivirga aplysinae TaxID=2529852 RepID=UPI0012BBDF1D|nr:bifunctional 5,10-methylenetetrahydrofolate dehydrogenase/5,10-methenyltetrahydrofolate cyclohydrolase [Curvivirga aplysinae]MTI11480.1 bifunctional 5,10-methylenetetrahydrofolate dehydrogenase/5,10-methenyltetrahydrofolate cyclohydrolase [Curvivirga aplysinae]
MGERDLRGKPIADGILEQVRKEAEEMSEQGWSPKLVSITVGDVEAVDVYVRNQRRTAERAGIEFQERHFPGDVTQDELRTAISAMNVDPRITGIIIQRPVPEQISVKALQTAIHPFKDVEGMHPTSIGNIVYSDTEIAPCTAAASVEMLKATGMSLEGMEVVVIGHSEIVGKPIAFLLMAEGATVTVCHHMTRSVQIHSRRADAILVAVGKPRLITGDMIKPGAAVIDIGINAIEEDGVEKLVGDVDYETASEVAGWITPVPGGVGPVTVSILMRNTMAALRRQKEAYDKQFAEQQDKVVATPSE